MCWSGGASAALASIGTATTLYAAWKKEPQPLWIALAYFTSMEWLQAFTYQSIDHCSLASNQISTLLGYLHITFQPFFINALTMHFIPKRISDKISVWVYGICFVSAITMIIQLFPFDWAGHCDPARLLCGPKLCSVHGQWHIAWEVPSNGIFNSTAHTIVRGFPTYFIAAFAMPIVYGSWRMTTYHFLVGPTLAHFLSHNENERPAIWCLLSIGILILVVKTPVRRLMYVNSWIFWEKISPEERVPHAGPPAVPGNDTEAAKLS